MSFPLLVLPWCLVWICPNYIQFCKGFCLNASLPVIPSVSLWNLIWTFEGKTNQDKTWTDFEYLICFTISYRSFPHSCSTLGRKIATLCDSFTSKSLKEHICPPLMHMLIFVNFCKYVPFVNLPPYFFPQLKNSLPLEL